MLPMAKGKFLLVDLSEPKTKKLAETITSETSRRILEHLADREDDTESGIAAALGIPLSTVHYHIQKLQEAKLIATEEFHYSPKGREVQHYKLANKYIIIAPKKIEGLREKLRAVLPVAGIALGVSALFAGLLALVSGRIAVFSASGTVSSVGSELQDQLLAKSVLEGGGGGGGSIATTGESAKEMVQNASGAAEEATAKAATVVAQQSDAVVWFLLGAAVTIIAVIIIAILWKYSRKKKQKG